ncbi:MAG: hypothetical protein V4724_23565, partial [Pseudomonadota bacterium]
HSIHNAGVGGSSPPITTKEYFRNGLDRKRTRPFLFYSAIIVLMTSSALLVLLLLLAWPTYLLIRARRAPTPLSRNAYFALMLVFCLLLFSLLIALGIVLGGGGRLAALTPVFSIPSALLAAVLLTRKYAARRDRE